jgi:branched-chain amino acid transport system substrate-binding protein
MSSWYSRKKLFRDMRSQHEEVREESLLDTTKRESEMPTGLHLNAALFSTALLATALATTPASAQKKYDTGATDTEIKIGNTIAYSGPASNYGTIAKAEAAYFNKINAEGGINGRKINFISYDDAYSPPKTVEQIRKLVEGDEVLFTFNTLGTPPNTAIQRYMNDKKVPQLFVGTGATKWGDPDHFPWTMGWQPTYQAEGRIYAKYILQNVKDPKIAIMYQNDDYGKDYVKGLKDGLGDKAKSLIVAEDSYETSEPTIDSHIVKLQASGANVFFDVSIAKFSAQAIKKIHELGWKPLHILNGVSTSIGAVMKPAGLDASQGVLSSAYLMDPTDPQWKDQPGMKEWFAFMDKWNPSADKTDAFNIYGYALARTMVQVLKQCGDNLTRDNVMKQAANLKSFEPGVLLPGIKINTSPTDFYPIEQEQLMRFKGDTWELFGPVLSGEASG